MGEMNILFKLKDPKYGDLMDFTTIVPMTKRGKHWVLVFT